MRPTFKPLKPYRRQEESRRLIVAAIAICLAILFAFGAYTAAKAAYRVSRGKPPDQIHLAWIDEPSTTITAVWHTYRTDTPSLIQYRPLGESEWRMEVGDQRFTEKGGVVHEVTIHNLMPDTRYEYRIKGDYFQRVWSEVFQARTAPTATAADFDVIYVADTGLVGRRDGLATGTQQVIDEIAKLNPLLVLAGGDYAYYNSDDRYGSLERSIDAWFNQMMPIFAQSPVMPTYGNHEALLQENYDLWAKHFATPEGIEHQRNYSFNVGNVHFVSIFAIYEKQGLNPEVLQWIEQDINAAKEAGQQWIIPFMHVSAFAEGASHPSNLVLRAQLGPLFEQLGVKVVLSSHDQAYERTYPLVEVPASNRPTSTSKTCYTLSDGVTWVKTSPGGKESSKNKHFSEFQSEPSPWIAVRNNTMHVFTRLHFSASNTLTVETFGVHGDGKSPSRLDHFSYQEECGGDDTKDSDP